VLSVLCVLVGVYGPWVVAAWGLSVLFETVLVVWAGVCLAGAAYLVCLGARLFFSAAPVVVAPVTAAPVSRPVFWQSVTVEVLNPKTALFFLAFLPQFIDPSAAFPIWLQFLILGVIVNWVFSSADLVCVLLAGWLAATLRRSAAAGRWAQRVGGTVIMGLGLNLALKP